LRGRMLMLLEIEPAAHTDGSDVALHATAAA
jgi:hypothetical protein